MYLIRLIPQWSSDLSQFKCQLLCLILHSSYPSTNFQHFAVQKEVCGWRILQHAAIGVWNNPWQCARYTKCSGSSGEGGALPAASSGVCLFRLYWREVQAGQRSALEGANRNSRCTGSKWNPSGLLTPSSNQPNCAVGEHLPRTVDFILRMKQT